MTATAATTGAPATKPHEPHAGRSRPRPAAAPARSRHARDLPRKDRIAHVYRTLGGGLVAEYDAD